MLNILPALRYWKPSGVQGGRESVDVLSDMGVEMVAAMEESVSGSGRMRTVILALCRGWAQPCAVSLTIEGSDWRTWPSRRRC